MADGDARPRNQRAQAVSDRLDVQDPVVQKKNLPAPVQFPLDGVPNHALVVRPHDRLHRQPVLRGRFNRAHVPRPGQRQVERARDRRRRQRQHVHRRPQLFEFFLVQHAETLLLVNNHQPQILERDVALQEPVRADDDVHRPGGQLPDDPGQFPPCAKPRQQFDAHRIIGHPLAKGVEMLLRQDGGGGEHGDLFAGQRGFEGGADGHFGLAVANVPADQPVHRARRFHVLFGGGDGPHLVGRLLIDKAVFKFALPTAVGRKSVAGLGSARGVDGQHVAGQVAHGVFGLRFRLGPPGAAQGVERRARLARADVLAHQMRLAHRHVEFGRGRLPSPDPYSMTRHSSPEAGERGRSG